jgi:phosphoribosylformylglycinamidine cyclo-ligase
MHAAVGDSGWFADTTRTNALVGGFAEGCRLAGAVWGGGETPTLGGVVEPEAIVLAGSAIGKISPKNLRIVGDVREGDGIIFFASSGVQTNGLSLCRRLAMELPKEYQTPIGHGDPRSFGEALLAPSVIYVAFVRECQRRGLKLNYVSHVTGHGWRKLMRLDEAFVYEITAPRPAPALFQFMMEAGPIERREMYATFNMGVGFAAFVSPENEDAALTIAKAAGYDAWLAGRVKKQGSRKAVVVPSLELTFEGDTLQVR